MHAPPYPAALDAQTSELLRRLVSQTRALDVLTQLAEQLAPLEDEGHAVAWRKHLLTMLQGSMTETHAAIQQTRAALAQLPEREGQS